MADLCPPGVNTPAEVLDLLDLAYGQRYEDGEDVMGETGLNTQGHRVVGEIDKKVGEGHNLTYGELLPSGVSKALGPERLQAGLVEGGIVLELGMGTGKICLQVFLQCPNLARVVGVELSPSRYALALAALERVAEKYPERFAVTRQEDATKPSAVLTEGKRTLEINQGDLFEVDRGLLESADVLYAQVVLPKEVHKQYQEFINTVKDGCRCFCYDNLEMTWVADAPCVFQQLEVNIQKRVGYDLYVDHYRTSWLPNGRFFFMGVADREMPPTITADSAQVLRDKVQIAKDIFGFPPKCAIL